MVFILPASLITSVEQFAIVTPAEKLYGQSTDIPQSRGGNSGPIFGQSNCPSHTWSITVGLFSYKIPGEPWWNWCWSCPSPTAAVIVQDFDFLSGNKKMEMCSVLFNFFNFFFLYLYPVPLFLKNWAIFQFWITTGGNVFDTIISQSEFTWCAGRSSRSRSPEMSRTLQPSSLQELPYLSFNTQKPTSDHRGFCVEPMLYVMRIMSLKLSLTE